MLMQSFDLIILQICLSQVYWREVYLVFTIVGDSLIGQNICFDCNCSSHGLWTTRESFFQKSETFGLGQTNWAEISWGIWGLSGQTISTILSLWVPCPWERVAGSLSYKKLWFLGLKHVTPKCYHKILAVKNLEKSLHTSVFGA